MGDVVTVRRYQMRRIDDNLIKLLLLVFLFLQYFGLQLVIWCFFKYLIKLKLFLLLNRQSTSIVVLFELCIVITNLSILHQLLLLMIVPDRAWVLLQAFDCFLKKLFGVQVCHGCVIGCCVVDIGGGNGGGRDDCCRVGRIVDNIFTAKRLRKVGSINHLHWSRSVLQPSCWVLSTIQVVSESSIGHRRFIRLSITMVAHCQLVLRRFSHNGEFSLIWVLIRVVFGHGGVSLGPSTCTCGKSAAAGIWVSIDCIVTDEVTLLVGLLWLFIVRLLSCIDQLPFKSQVDDLITHLSQLFNFLWRVRCLIFADALD